jgi:acyl-CoA thioesterase-2
LPDDPLVHAAAIVQFTDTAIANTVSRHYRYWQRGATSASLNHTVWWHREPRYDDWMLYVLESDAAHAQRALIRGRVYTRMGALAVSVAQEAIFPPPPSV